MSYASCLPPTTPIKYCPTLVLWLYRQLDRKLRTWGTDAMQRNTVTLLSPGQSSSQQSAGRSHILMNSPVSINSSNTVSTVIVVVRKMFPFFVLRYSFGFLLPNPIQLAQQTGKICEKSRSCPDDNSIQKSSCTQGGEWRELATGQLAKATGQIKIALIIHTITL